MDIVLIGAGNVATHLGAALVKANHRILQVYSRTFASAKSLAKQLDAAYVDDIGAVRTDAELYLYAVTDSALPSLIGAVEAPNALHLHTAGSVPISIFKDKCLHYGVFYPLQTFSKTKEIDVDTTPIFVEGGDTTDEGRIVALAKTISRQVLYATSEQRCKLHLAAVFACNFTNCMYAIAHRQLEEAGLPFEVLLPLIDETAEKVHHLKPHNAQTGPAVRYDVEVMDKHIQMLTSDSLKELYRKISKEIYQNR